MVVISLIVTVVGRLAAQHGDQPDGRVVAGGLVGSGLSALGHEVERGALSRAWHGQAETSLGIGARLRQLLRCPGAARPQGHGGLSDRLSGTQHLALEAGGGHSGCAAQQANGGQGRH
jgi:hypothetical protein